MYTWRHNRVLAILAEITEIKCRVANKQPTQDPKPCISFLQEGEAPPRQVSKPQGEKFLAAARDWKMAADLKEALHFPHHIVHTQERPDIVIWSDTVKRVIIVELTVPWEENMEEAFERKKLRYENLRMECEDKGWACPVMPIAHRGWLSWLHRPNNNLIPNQAWTNKQGQTEGHTAASNSSGKGIELDLVQSQKEHHSRTKSPPPPFPPFPPSPSPTTTSIPIPSSAYRASRSTCSPQWHHPVAEAAGGARAWGTTGSRRNHLTRSGRWLTRVMSRQLLLHVVCIYY